MSNLIRCPSSVTSPITRTADACAAARLALARMPAAGSFSTPLGASARDVVALAGESGPEPQPVTTIAIKANNTSSRLIRTCAPESGIDSDPTADGPPDRDNQPPVGPTAGQG